MANKNPETLNDAEFDAIFGCLDGEDTVEQASPIVEAPKAEAEAPKAEASVAEFKPVTKSVTEAYKGRLSADGNRAKSVKAEGSLTARRTGRAGAKAGLSDPVE